MNGRKLVILAAAAALIIAAGILVMDSGLFGGGKQTSGGSTAAPVAAESSQTAVQSSTGSSTSDITTGIPEPASTGDNSGESDSGALINQEEVEVGYNTPEYDLQLELCENTDKKTFLRLQYYLNGAATVEELDEGELPELAGLFENRAAGGNTWRIGQALLNPVHSHLYLLIQGAPLDKYVQAAFYMVDLTDLSIRKLFSYPGLYGKMAFNKDYGMLAWSFGDPPVMSTYQADNLLEVFDCKEGDFIIKGSAYSGGKLLGSNSDPELLYDYEFESWKSGTVLKLKQAVRPLKDPNAGLTQTEVLYDIKKNLLLDSDGSVIKPAGSKTSANGTSSGKTGNVTGGAVSGDGGAKGTAEGGDPGKKADSEPLRTLKDFYSYLGSLNNYTKAMNLLDETFKLRLQMIKQFGAEELVKSDIDQENASLYSDLLKTARFDSLSQEITKDGVSSILYFQILEPSPGTEINQQMTATLRKTNKGWKITLIEDGLN